MRRRMSGELAERLSGSADSESRLFMELGAIGIYPEFIEIKSGKVRLSVRALSVGIRLDRLMAGLHAAIGPGADELSFFLKDRPFVRNIRYLSRLGRRTKGPLEGAKTGRKNRG